MFSLIPYNCSRQPVTFDDKTIVDADKYFAAEIGSAVFIDLIFGVVLLGLGSLAVMGKTTTPFSPAASYSILSAGAVYALVLFIVIYKSRKEIHSHFPMFIYGVTLRPLTLKAFDSCIIV